MFVSQTPLKNNFLKSNSPYNEVVIIPGLSAVLVAQFMDSRQFWFPFGRFLGIFLKLFEFLGTLHIDLSANLVGRFIQFRQFFLQNVVKLWMYVRHRCFSNCVGHITVVILPI